MRTFLPSAFRIHHTCTYSIHHAHAASPYTLHTQTHTSATDCHINIRERELRVPNKRREERTTRTHIHTKYISAHVWMYYVCSHTHTHISRHHTPPSLAYGSHTYANDGHVRVCIVCRLTIANNRTIHRAATFSNKSVIHKRSIGNDATQQTVFCPMPTAFFRSTLNIFRSLAKALIFILWRLPIILCSREIIKTISNWTSPEVKKIIAEKSQCQYKLKNTVTKNIIEEIVEKTTCAIFVDWIKSKRRKTKKTRKTDFPTTRLYIVVVCDIGYFEFEFCVEVIAATAAVEVTEKPCWWISESFRRRHKTKQNNVAFPGSDEKYSYRKNLCGKKIDVCIFVDWIENIN